MDTLKGTTANLTTLPTCNAHDSTDPTVQVYKRPANWWMLGIGGGVLIISCLCLVCICNYSSTTPTGPGAKPPSIALKSSGLILIILASLGVSIGSFYVYTTTKDCVRDPNLQ